MVLAMVLVTLCSMMVMVTMMAYVPRHLPLPLMWAA